MRKSEIDHLLEAVVAKALGVKLPPKARRRTVHGKKPAAPSIRHAA